MSYTFLLVALALIPFFFIIGSPVFAVVGGVATLIFYYSGESLAVVAQDVFRLASAPSLVALPLFIFAGYYLAESKFAARLLKLFESMVGWMKGGVCLAAIIATDIFTAFTGASAITIVAFGGLIVPMLMEKGHTKKFSEGLLTISGGSGALFPPCFAVILYGLISRTNIRWLYIAGLIPALLFITAQFSYSLYVNIKEDIPTVPFSMKRLINAISDLIWEIPLLLMIVVGIMVGFITIEEAATTTVVGFFVIEGLIRKEVKWKKVPYIMSESMMMLGALFLIMGCAMALTDYMVIKEVPQKVLEAVQGVISSKLAFLMFLNLFLLIVGMTMDMFSAILVIVPLILPVAQSYGIDPFHLGVVFFLNLEIGYVTPPFGVSLFISSLRFRAPLLGIFKGVIPFFAAELVALLVITYYEDLSLWLLRVLDLKPLIDVNMI